MKPGSLLLTLGSLVLLALPLLLGAPLKSRCLLKCQRDEDCPVGHTCASFRGKQLCRPIAAVADSGVPGTPSPTHGSHTEMPQSSGTHSKGETASEPPLPDASMGDTQLTQSHPVPTSPPERGNGTRETLLEEAAPAPSKKPVCIKKPHPKVSMVDAGPAELPRGEVLDSGPGEGVGKASGGREEVLARENSTRPLSTEKDSTSDKVYLTHEDAPSGNKPIGGSGSASSNPSSKPPLGEKPASNVDSGHTAHGKPISSGKPAGKPISALGNQTEASPTPGSKPMSHSGGGAHKEEAPHEKPESAEKPAPEKKPEPAPEKKPEPAPEKKPEPAPEKKPEPAPEKKPEPAEEAKKDGSDDSSTEGTEEEDEETVEEEDREPDGESDEDSDAFDKELDYGLDRSPYNAYEYHDAWSDDGSDYPAEWLDPGLAEDAASLGDGEPVFDVWGDRVGRRGLETGWFSQQPVPGV